MALTVVTISDTPQASGVIYGILHPRDKNLRYIGKTTAQPPAKRLYTHLKSAHEKKTQFQKWLCALSEPPEFIILESNPLNLDMSERAWIAAAKQLKIGILNGTEGGTGGALVGESLEKMKRSRKGQKHTEETKKKISEHHWLKTNEGKLWKSKNAKKMWSNKSKEQKQKIFDALNKVRFTREYALQKCANGCKCLRHVSRKCLNDCKCKRHISREF